MACRAGTGGYFLVSWGGGVFISLPIKEEHNVVLSLEVPTQLAIRESSQIHMPDKHSAIELKKKKKNPQLSVYCLFRDSVQPDLELTLQPRQS